MPRECTDIEDLLTGGHDHRHSSSRHRPQVARLIFSLTGPTSCEYHGCAKLTIFQQLTAHLVIAETVDWPCMHASDVGRAAQSHVDWVLTTQDASSTKQSQEQAFCSSFNRFRVCNWLVEEVTDATTCCRHSACCGSLLNTIAMYIPVS
jgi:hypothetical protein